MLNARVQKILVLDDHNPGPWHGADRATVIDLLADSFALKTIWLPRAQAGEYPMNLHGLSSSKAVDAEEMVSVVDRDLARIESEIAILESKVKVKRAEAAVAVAGLLQTVKELHAAGEVALFENHSTEEEFESARMEALAQMKAVGRRSGAARSLVAGRGSTDLRLLMRSLIDGTYLHLSKPTVDRRLWDESVQAVEEVALRLSGSAGIQNGLFES